MAKDMYAGLNQQRVANATNMGKAIGSGIGGGGNRQSLGSSVSPEKRQLDIDSKQLGIEKQKRDAQMSILNNTHKLMKSDYNLGSKYYKENAEAVGLDPSVEIMTPVLDANLVRDADGNQGILYQGEDGLKFRPMTGEYMSKGEAKQDYASASKLVGNIDKEVFGLNQLLIQLDYNPSSINKDTGEYDRINPESDAEVDARFGKDMDPATAAMISKLMGSDAKGKYDTKEKRKAASKLVFDRVKLLNKSKMLNNHIITKSKGFLGMGDGNKGKATKAIMLQYLRSAGNEAEALSNLERDGYIVPKKGL